MWRRRAFWVLAFFWFNFAVFAPNLVDFGRDDLDFEPFPETSKIVLWDIESSKQVKQFLFDEETEREFVDLGWEGELEQSEREELFARRKLGEDFRRLSVVYHGNESEEEGGPPGAFGRSSGEFIFVEPSLPLENEIVRVAMVPEPSLSALLLLAAAGLLPLRHRSSH